MVELGHVSGAIATAWESIKINITANYPHHPRPLSLQPKGEKVTLLPSRPTLPFRVL